jgi:hypothetical protein
MYSTPHRVATRFGERALLGRYDYTRPGYLNYYAGDAEQVEAVRRATHEQVNAAGRRPLFPVPCSLFPVPCSLRTPARSGRSPRRRRR